MRVFPKTILNLLLVLFSFCCASKQDSLGKKYPYARLTPDYGILNEQDLLISEQDAYPVPLSEDSLAYPYWKCFQTDQITFGCSDLDTDDHGTPMSDIVITVKANDEYEEYGGRHGIPLSTCQEEYIAKWNAITQGEKYACIAGSYAGPEIQSVAGKKSKGRGWIYDRLKTKKGCVSYFEGDCGIDKIKKP